MMRFGNSETFNLDEQFVNKQDADKYVELMQKNAIRIVMTMGIYIDFGSVRAKTGTQKEEYAK